MSTVFDSLILLEPLYRRHADSGALSSFCLTNLALLVGSRLHIEDLAVVKSARSQLTSLASRTCASWRVVSQFTATSTDFCIGQAPQASWVQMSSLLTDSSRIPLIHRSRQQCSARTAKLRSTRIWEFCEESASRIRQQQRSAIRFASPNPTRSWRHADSVV